MHRRAGSVVNEPWGVLTRAVVGGVPLIVLDWFVGETAEDRARAFAFERWAFVKSGELGRVTALEVVCGPLDLAKLRAGVPLVPDSRMSLSLIP